MHPAGVDDGMEESMICGCDLRLTGRKLYLRTLEGVSEERAAERDFRTRRWPRQSHT